MAYKFYIKQIRIFYYFWFYCSTFSSLFYLIQNLFVLLENPSLNNSIKDHTLFLLNYFYNVCFIYYFKLHAHIADLWTDFKDKLSGIKLLKINCCGLASELYNFITINVAVQL